MPAKEAFAPSSETAEERAATRRRPPGRSQSTRYADSISERSASGSSLPSRCWSSGATARDAVVGLASSVWAASSATSEPRPAESWNCW